VSTTFLFGAGASFGSGPCLPYAPPLGRDFFAKLQAQGGIASKVHPDLAKLFKDDFEAGMDRFWVERQVDTTELLRDMAKYFAKFKPGPGNFYSRLVQIMGRNRRYVMATTNYDMLIELAAGEQNLRTAYRALPVAADCVAVLKIHGSCNFLPRMPPDQIQGIGFILSGETSSILEVGIRPAASAREVIDYCNSADSIAPALALYSPSKRVLFGADHVLEQQRAWIASVSTATRIYVIGMRVHPVDEHIWGTLSKAKVPVYYVGREPDMFREWASSVKLRSGKVLATSFDEALPRIADHHRRPLR
jgi:hypothetical protein